MKSRSVSRVVVATDSEEVAQSAHAGGFDWVMTRADHPNGTSRIAEAADSLGLRDDEIVLNVQGDEPEIEPGHIDSSVSKMVELGCEAGTSACALRDEDVSNPNVVKVVVSGSGRALYFSRLGVPFVRDPGDRPPARLRHIGMYVYRRGFLRRYASFEQTPLERAEKLEQLRVLEHDVAMSVAVVAGDAPPGIDTTEQYEAFVARWRARTGVAGEKP